VIANGLKLRDYNSRRSSCIINSESLWFTEKQVDLLSSLPLLCQNDLQVFIWQLVAHVCHLLQHLLLLSGLSIAVGSLILLLLLYVQRLLLWRFVVDSLFLLLLWLVKAAESLIPQSLLLRLRRLGSGLSHRLRPVSFALLVKRIPALITSLFVVLDTPVFVESEVGAVCVEVATTFWAVLLCRTLSRWLLLLRLRRRLLLMVCRFLLLRWIF